MEVDLPEDWRKPHTMVVFSLYILLCVCYLVFFGRHAYSAAVSWCRRLMKPSWAVDSIKKQQHIESVVWHQRGLNFIRVSKAQNAVATLVAAGICLNVLGHASRYMTPIQDWALLLFTVCTMFIGIRPSVALTRWRSVLYSWLMLVASSAVASGAKSEVEFFFVETFLIPSRFMFSVAYGGRWLVVFWNFIYSVAFVVGYRASSANGDLDWLLQTVWQREVLIFSAVLYSVYVSTNFLSGKARGELEAKALCGEIDAITELLNLVCDVVVELDSDLRIAHDAPRFAAFVTLNAQKDVRGTKLTQFMPMEDDSERFETCLRACESVPLPGALHTTMRDSLGNNMQVEVFFVHFDSPDRAGRYFVGVREFTDMAGPTAELSSQGFSSRRISRRRARSMRSTNSRSSRSNGDGAGGSQAGSEMSVDDSTSTIGSSISTRSTRISCRIPFAKPTLEPAQDVMLADVVMHWNFRSRMTTCCPWHAATMELKHTLRRLEDRPCSHQFGKESLKEKLFQCDACGVVALPDSLYTAGRPTVCPACSGSWKCLGNVMCL